MLGLMYSAMTIIKVVQLQWNPFLVIIVLCRNIFNSLSSQNNNVCLGKVYSLVNKVTTSHEKFSCFLISKSPNLLHVHVFGISVLWRFLFLV